MDVESWKRIDDLFSRAIDLPLDQRAEFLTSACGDDIELRSQVEKLLVQDANADADFLKPDPLNIKQQLSPVSDDPMIGKMLGRFEVVRRIGKGGMGNVYLAVRRERYRQQVAIKVLKRGMDTDEVLRRFSRETRVLATVGKHSNIAGLLDAGTTDDGLPFFVMDYVDGQRIDEYCRKQKLNIRERLNLFRDVCAAVQFAHQHAVIHRDLKPGNVLVTTEGVVKLIDFGIAKLTTPELSDETAVHTRTGGQLLTPAYASPEQITGDSVTTRSDVYSLGVLLYELLTEKRPFEDSEGHTDEMKQAVTDTEPPFPSAKVRTSSQGAALTRQLRGDLDTIVLKALRKSPGRRYATVEQFSEDIQRFLDRDPITARPMGRVERWWRACQRNPLAASLLLAILVACVLGLWHLRSLSWQMIRESELNAVRHQAILLNSAQAVYSDLIEPEVKDQPSTGAASGFNTPVVRPSTPPIAPTTTIPVPMQPPAPPNRVVHVDKELPVTESFTFQLGEHLAKRTSSGLRARIFTESEAGDSGPSDGFERNALDWLKANPDDEYYRFTEDTKGRRVLRYAIARYNEGTAPKNGPKSFRSVLAVYRPIQQDYDRFHDGLATHAYLVLATAGVLTIVFLLAFVSPSKV